MSFEIVGYYTRDACYMGNPMMSDPSITQIVIEGEKKNTRVVSPAYLPNIVSPFSPAPFPKIYRSVEEIKTMLRDREKYGAKFNGLKELSKNRDELKALLLRADESGDIKWASNNEKAPIYQLVQDVIDGSSNDVHLVVGYNHEIEEQISFINELISSGRDGRKLSGITHLALEMFGTEEKKENDIPAALVKWERGNREFRREMYRYDFQAFIDYYLGTKDNAVFGLFQNYVLLSSNIENKACYDDQVETLRIAADEANEYKAIASSLSIAETKSLKELTAGKEFVYAAGEAFAVDTVQYYLNPGERDVVLYIWGLEHTEKEGLPKHIRFKDESNTVISVALNGGVYDDKVYFDRALEEMGRINKKWKDNAFVWVLKGYREADFIIHLTNKSSPIVYTKPRAEAPLIILR